MFRYWKTSTAMEGQFFFRDADVEGLRIYQDSVSAVVALYYDARFGMGIKPMRPYSIYSHCWKEAPDVAIKWRKRPPRSLQKYQPHTVAGPAYNPEG